MEYSLLNGSSLSNVSLSILCLEYFMYTLIWIVLCAVFVILGLPITLLLLRELIKKARQNVSNELFMLNLAIVNLAYIGITPFSMVDSLVWHNKTFECINTIMDAFILCATPLFVTCLCVDCYFAVVQPIAYRSNKKIVIRKAACIIVWLSTITFISHKCYEMFAFPLPLNSGPLVFSLPAIIFCNIATVLALRKTDPARKGMHPQKKRALHTIFNSLIIISLVYTPPVVIFSFADLMPLKGEKYHCTVGVFGFMLSMSGCVIMPILHLNTTGKLDNLKELLKKCLCTCYSITASTVFTVTHSTGRWMLAEKMSPWEYLLRLKLIHEPGYLFISRKSQWDEFKVSLLLLQGKFHISWMNLCSMYKFIKIAWMPFARFYLILSSRVSSDSLVFKLLPVKTSTCLATQWFNGLFLKKHTALI